MLLWFVFFSKNLDVLIQSWACFVSRCYPGVSVPHSAGIIAGLFPTSEFPFFLASVGFTHNCTVLLPLFSSCSTLSKVFALSYSTNYPFPSSVLGRGADAGGYILYCFGAGAAPGGKRSVPGQDSVNEVGAHGGGQVELGPTPSVGLSA